MFFDDKDIKLVTSLRIKLVTSYPSVLDQVFQAACSSDPRRGVATGDGWQGREERPPDAVGTGG